MPLSRKHVTFNSEGLTNIIHPDLAGNFHDMYRSGWLPEINQQWGGSQWGRLPDGAFGSVATCNIQDDSSSTGNFGNSTSNYYNGGGFIVAETATYDQVQVKLSKVGNPATTITARIYTDTAGSPNVAIGSASTLSAKLITSNPNGDWYSFTGLAAALTAGTQYHIVLTTSSSDAANYIITKVTANNKYPFGFFNNGSNTPTWLQYASLQLCFAVVNPVANSIIQSGGRWDYKLVFNSGTPWNQSRYVVQPLINFYDAKTCTILYRGTFVASSNVLDFSYGLDHDRITLTINASGYPVVTAYRQDRTAYTVTGTGAVTTGFHDASLKIRTFGDGADYLYLLIDGVSVGTPLTAQTFTMDALMPLLGTARLGDGFGLTPAWTQDMQMASLPSLQGYTWTGTATEANAMSVSGGKLYQNANGYTSTQTGYYTKTTVFNNTTGWTVAWKGKVALGANTAATNGMCFYILDGTKAITVQINEGYLQVNGTGAIDFTIQGDFKTQENVVVLQGSANSFYLFINGNLAIDGTGKLTATSATNQIGIGDADATAGINVDVVTSYFKYYQGGMLLPTANTGTCSEFAHWSGDKSALLSYAWNSGNPISIKQLCGINKNYIGEGVTQKGMRLGITSAPTVASPTDTLEADMECYVIGSIINVDALLNASNSVAGNTMSNNIYIDGTTLPSEAVTVSAPVAAYKCNISSKSNRTFPVGLHRVEAKTSASSGVTTETLTARHITVEAKS